MSDDAPPTSTPAYRPVNVRLRRPVATYHGRPAARSPGASSAQTARSECRPWMASPPCSSSSCCWRSPSTTRTGSTTRPTRSPRRSRRAPCRPAGPSSWRRRSTSSARSPGRPSPRPSAAAWSTTQTTTQAIVAAALIGAIAWNLITWQQGLPSSSSHALIGGLLGATIIGVGTGALNVDGIVNKVLIPMFTSPILGFAIAFALMLALYWIFRRLEAQADGPPVPAAAGLLGGVHGLRPRLERRPEDDGHHHPRPVLGRRHPGGRRADLGHHRVGHRAVARDRGRWLADHEDDGPAGRQARAGPRLRGRDDGGHRSCSTTAHFGMPVSTTQVISSAIMGVGSSQGVRARPLGRRPAHPHRLDPDHPGGRHPRRPGLGRPQRARRHDAVDRHDRVLPHRRRDPDELPPAAEGPQVLRAVHRRRRQPGRGRDRAPRDGRPVRPARGAGRQHPGAREARRRDRRRGQPAARGRVRHAVRPRGHPRAACRGSTTSSTASSRSPRRSSSTASTSRRAEARRLAAILDGQGSELAAALRQARRAEGPRAPLRGDPRAREGGRRPVAGGRRRASSTTSSAPIEVIKWRDLYNDLEDTIDAAEDAAEAMERMYHKAN